MKQIALLGIGIAFGLAAFFSFAGEAHAQSGTKIVVPAEESPPSPFRFNGERWVYEPPGGKSVSTYRPRVAPKGSGKKSETLPRPDFQPPLRPAPGSGTKKRETLPAPKGGYVIVPDRSDPPRVTPQPVKPLPPVIQRQYKVLYRACISQPWRMYACYTSRSTALRIADSIRYRGYYTCVTVDR